MRRLIFFLVLTSTYLCSCEESSQYLQNAVRDLRKMNFRQTLRRADTKLLHEFTTIAPTIEEVPSTPESERRRVFNNINKDVPPLSLTKGELAALYENAIAKGDTIKLNAGDNSFVHAAVAEIGNSDPSKPNQHSDREDDSSGYYYYYYPIKSFMDELSSESSGKDRFLSNPPHSHEDPYHNHVDEYYHDYPPHHDKPHDDHDKPNYNYHAHHHQHNVNITHMKTEMEKKPSKPLEPLFMAITGFIGAAMMLFMTVLMLPKLKLKPTTATKKNSKNERISDIARIAISAIEGQDCTERFACELGKTARSFSMNDNRFMKLLKRIAPSTFGKHIDKVGRYSNKRLMCTAIPCKKKQPPKTNKKNQNAQKKS